MRTIVFIFCFYAFAAGAQPSSWYKMYVGYIGKYPVVLHLHKAGHVFDGYYYYERTQQPLAVMGTGTAGAAGVIKLNVTSTAAGEETFTFVLRGDSAIGSWRQAEKKDAQTFVASEKKPSLPLSFASVSSTHLLKPKYKDSPVASFTAAVVWPAQPGKAAQVIRSSIRSFIDSMAINAEPVTLLHKMERQYFDRYTKEHAGVKEAEIKERPSTFMSDQTSKVLVVYSDERLLSLALFTYAYTGGAHGNYGTAYESFDLISGKKLLLQDVLTPEGIKNLPGLLAAAFRKQRGLGAAASLTEGGLFENKIVPNKNFFVTGKGIGFNFTPYEIGPYVLGEITLYLTYTDLQQMLQPSFGNSLKKN